MNTGIQRSLTVTIEKKVLGAMQPGYPITYEGKNAFVFGDNNYEAITTQELCDMSEENYNIRLADFKQYVQHVEAGLSIDTVQTNLPFLENTTACPIS